MNQLEIEYKTLLTEREYLTLLPDFELISPIQQTNYYIDSPEADLRSKRLSLRIRTYPDRAELTLKIPQEVGNLEYNQNLDLELIKGFKHLLTLPDGEIKDKLVAAGIDLSRLTILGHLTTRRREVQLDMGLLAIDSNTYAGIKDYELELEVADPVQGKADFDAFLAKHQINLKYAKSKVARFAATLKTEHPRPKNRRKWK